MRKFFVSLLVPISFALAAGCGGGDDDDGGGSGSSGSAEAEGNGRLRTSGSTKIIAAVDTETGLRLELQNDGVYLKATGKTPADLRGRLTGRGLGAHCDGPAGKTIPGLNSGFPVYWRESFSDWGSALARTQTATPTLAEQLVSCSIYGSRPDGQVEIGGAAKPVATIKLR